MLLQTLKDLSKNNFGDTAFVTGLRAYAALMVIMIHAGGAGLRNFGEIGNRIADLGATGVYIFFVISGFCIAHSLSHKSNIKQFLYKRFCRIAPMYYLVCALGLLFVFFGDPVSTWRAQYEETSTLYDFFMHIGFLSFLDYRIANSLVGVEWSIPIEMFWYLIIPFAMPLLRNWWSVIILFALTCVVFAAKVLYPHFLPADVVGEAVKWSPVRYAPAFFLGLLAFKLRPWASKTFKPWLLDFGLLALLIAGFSELIYFQIGNEFLNILLLSFGIILLGGAGPISSFLFERKSVIFLGTISYSLYLTHMFVLHFLPEHLNSMPLLKFSIALALTTIISTLSYVFVEQKGIEVSRKIKSQ